MRAVPRSPSRSGRGPRVDSESVTTERGCPVVMRRWPLNGMPPANCSRMRNSAPFARWGSVGSLAQHCRRLERPFANGGQDEPVGTQLWLAAGTVTRVEDAAAIPGTSIEVSDLFFNTPARRKFLKSRRRSFFSHQPCGPAGRTRLASSASPPGAQWLRSVRASCGVVGPGSGAPSVSRSVRGSGLGRRCGT